jgi:hypothetical protein
MPKKTPKFSDYKTALQWLCDQKDAPEAAKKDALQTLKAYDRAVTLYNREQKTCAELRTDAQQWRERALHDLLSDLQGSSNVKTVGYVERCNQADALVATGEQTLTLAHSAVSRLTGAVQMGCLRTHAPALLTWIAQRRTGDMHACGYTDELPTHLEVIYNYIRPQWWSEEWRAPLQLGTEIFLPIIYNEQWSVPYRSSLACVWSEFAAGNVTHHLHTDKRQRHSLNRQITELPTAPAAINETQPIKINF